jgi:hypothetical protein
MVKFPVVVSVDIPPPDEKFKFPFVVILPELDTIKVVAAVPEIISIFPVTLNGFIPQVRLLALAPVSALATLIEAIVVLPLKVLLGIVKLAPVVKLKLDPTLSVKKPAVLAS